MVRVPRSVSRMLFLLETDNLFSVFISLRHVGFNNVGESEVFAVMCSFISTYVSVLFYVVRKKYSYSLFDISLYLCINDNAAFIIDMKQYVYVYRSLRRFLSGLVENCR